MTILSKLYSVAFKNYSYKAKNWRTVLPCNAKKKFGHIFRWMRAYPISWFLYGLCTKEASIQVNFNLS